MLQKQNNVSVNLFYSGKAVPQQFNIVYNIFMLLTIDNIHKILYRFKVKMTKLFLKDNFYFSIRYIPLAAVSCAPFGRISLPLSSFG